MSSRRVGWRDYESQDDFINARSVISSPTHPTNFIAQLDLN